MATSTNSLFSTAVISGSSSAPNLHQINTTSPSGTLHVLCMQFAIIFRGYFDNSNGEEMLIDFKQICSRFLRIQSEKEMNYMNAGQVHFFSFGHKNRSFFFLVLFLHFSSFELLLSHINCTNVFNIADIVYICCILLLSTSSSLFNL